MGPSRPCTIWPGLFFRRISFRQMCGGLLLLGQALRTQPHRPRPAQKISQGGFGKLFATPVAGVLVGGSKDNLHLPEERITHRDAINAHPVGG